MTFAVDSSARPVLHGFCEPGAGAQHSVKLAHAEDLDDVASVIARAIDAWPAPDRLKRRVLPVLHYNALDLEDHELLLVSDTDQPVAVAAWQLDARITDPHHRVSTLLHGLFVVKEAQRRGLGQSLQALVARRATTAGYHGLHVKAERFAVTYFETCGYRRLRPSEQPRADDAPYPYWFWRKCAQLSPVADRNLHSDFARATSTNHKPFEKPSTSFDAV